MSASKDIQMAIGIIIGVAFSVVLGTAIGNIGIRIVVGISLGTAAAALQVERR